MLPVKLCITPVPKPRMTRSDAWKKRACVLRYWEFKDELSRLWGDDELPEQIELVFVLPMPVGWTEKRKTLMSGRPHQAKPDADNLCKAVWDCLAESDSYIWQVKITKLWGFEGSITIGNLGE